jgi:hypothetical protein
VLPLCIEAVFRLPARRRAIDLATGQWLRIHASRKWVRGSSLAGRSSLARHAQRLTVRLPAVAGSILVRPVILRRGVLNKTLPVGRLAAEAVGIRSAILNFILVRLPRRTTITARRLQRSAIAPRRLLVTVRRITMLRLRRNIERRARRHPTGVAPEAEVTPKADIRAGVVVVDTTADKKFPLGRSSLLTEPERPLF